MAEWSKATDLSSVIIRDAQVRTLLVAIAPLAQLVMRRTYNAEIVGSSPTWSKGIYLFFYFPFIYLFSSIKIEYIDVFFLG